MTTNRKLVQDLEKKISKFNVKEQFSEIVILCVGTIKIIGDAIGPIVGQKLIEVLKVKKNKRIIVCGNIYNTLNFNNAKNILRKIDEECENPFIITIDSALGNMDMVEKIFVNDGIISLGSSLGRSISYNSHINIKCVVGENKNDAEENFETLRNVNINSIINVSNTIVYGINEVIKKINYV